tara:strand:+ start:17518 stop:17781 length:264 start_codon:yes stop_codon:yes gene_type:complete
MPLYSYDCLECKVSVNIRHSYAEKDVYCPKCDSKNIKKNLSKVLQATKKCYNIKEQAGIEVRKAIEGGKQELNDYKKKQQKKVYTKK